MNTLGREGNATKIFKHTLSNGVKEIVSFFYGTPLSKMTMYPEKQKEVTNIISLNKMVYIYLSIYQVPTFLFN